MDCDGISRDGFGIVQAEARGERRCGRFQIGVSLGLRGFGLLQVGFGDGAVCEEIFRASVEFVGEGRGVASFDVGGARDGIIGTGDEEERLTVVNDLARRDENFVHRTADGRKDRSGLKGVVGNGAGKAQGCAEDFPFAPARPGCARSGPAVI